MGQAVTKILTFAAFNPLVQDDYYRSSPHLDMEKKIASYSIREIIFS